MRLAAGRQLPDWLSCDSGRHTRELTKVRAGYCFNPPCGSQTSNSWKGKLSVLKTRRLPIGPVTLTCRRPSGLLRPLLGEKNLAYMLGWDYGSGGAGT